MCASAQTSLLLLPGSKTVKKKRKQEGCNVVMFFHEEIASMKHGIWYSVPTSYLPLGFWLVDGTFTCNADSDSFTFILLWFIKMGGREGWEIFLFLAIILESIS
jgi:hypothetical protein